MHASTTDPSSSINNFTYKICYRTLPTDIMLQLKRTAEVISVGCGRGRLKTVIDGALSAGKAARNEKIVPEIKKLKAYGSDGTPPLLLAKEVANVRNYVQYLELQPNIIFQQLVCSGCDRAGSGEICGDLCVKTGCNGHECGRKHFATETTCE